MVEKMKFLLIFDARSSKSYTRTGSNRCACVYLVDVFVCECQNKVYFHFWNSELWMFTKTYRRIGRLRFDCANDIDAAVTHDKQRQLDAKKKQNPQQKEFSCFLVQRNFEWETKTKKKHTTTSYHSRWWYYSILICWFNRVLVAHGMLSFLAHRAVHATAVY